MLTKRYELLPVETYPVGFTPFGPVALHDDVIAVFVELYRCTTRDPSIWPEKSTFIRVIPELSGDRGKTWDVAGGLGHWGGIEEHYKGHEHDSILGTMDVPQAADRWIRGTIEVVGAPARTGLAIELHRVPLHLAKRIGRWPQLG